MSEDKNKNEASKKAIAEQKARIQAEKEFGQSLSYAQTSLMEQVRLLKEQQGLVAGLVRSSKMLNDSTKQNVELKNDLSRLYSDELQVANDVILKRAMVKTQLQGEYSQYLAQYMIQKKIKDVNDPRLANLIKELKHRQELNKHLEEERDLYETVAAKTLEIREEAESYKKSLKGVLATAQAIGNDPKTMGAFVLTQAIEKTEKLVEGFEHFKEQGLSAGQAMAAQFKSMDVFSADYLLGLSDTSGVMNGVIEQYGNVNALSKETVGELGKMAVHFGISGQEAAKLNASLSQMPGETSETAANAMHHVGAMAEMEGIAPGKIMKDMAANTGEMARAGAKGAEEFGKSVIELHKMGVEMQTASKIADGLLDFESSINAQNEASVLLGREINLDKARELALNNDLEGATKEILKNVGSSADFNKMNRLEQDALAKSVGMTVEELTKSLDAQEESNKYFGEGASLGMTALGYMSEYGSKAAGFFKENGLLILSTLQFLSMGNGLQMIGNGLQMAKNGLLLVGQGIAFATSLIYSAENREKVAMWAKQKAQWVAEKAHMAYLKTAAAFGSKGAAGKLAAMGGGGAAGGAADKLGDVASGATDKATSAASNAQKLPNKPGGVGKTLKDVASGIKAFGSGKVLAGAAILVASAVGLVAMLPAIPTILLLSIPGIGQGFSMNMKAISKGLSSLGNAASNPYTWLGILLLAAFGAALIPLTFALSLLAPVIEAFGKVILAVFQGMAILVKAVAESFVLMFESFAEHYAVLPLVGLGLMVLGTGLGILAAAALVAAPAFLLLGASIVAFSIAALFASFGFAVFGAALTVVGVGVTAIAVGMAAIGLAVEKLSTLIGPATESLVGISQAAPGLLLVATAVGGIAAGLGLMAVAGFAALPAITALIGLAAVAPALVALGGALGGLFGGGGEKEDKMDELISEVRALKAVMAQGGVINMDGKKVGDVLRLSISKSGIK